MSPLIAGIILAQATQAPCGTVHEIVQRLATEYHEKTAIQGVAQNGELFSLFTSPAGTWTVVKVTPKGRACIMDAGQGFQLLPQGDPA